MPNIVSYTRNLTKSVKYATIDVMKEMNPVFTSFYENNSDVLKSTYNAIADIKGTTQNIKDNDTVSKVGGLARLYYSNLKSDLRSGKFYNKERKTQYDNEVNVGGDFSDEDFGLSFDDDSDELDISVAPSSGSSSSSLSFDDMDAIAEKQVNATGEIIARSAQYQVEAQRQSTNALMNQNAEIFGRMHSNLGVINSNLSMVINYMKESTTTHYNNSKTYYETSTTLMQESNAMLKELLELEKKKYEEPKRTGSSKKEFSDIFTSEGAIDLREYVEMIKENLSSTSSGMGGMLKDYLDNGAIKSMIAASPLEGIMKTAIKTVIPSLLKDSFAELNKSVAGAMGSIITKLGTGMDDSGLIGSIMKVLGFTPDSLKKTLDTSQYNKGAVPFDGVTRKAIIEVIPTYLSKIYSAVSGKEESRFNYEKGKFTSVSGLRKELQDVYDIYGNRASGDIRRSFNQMKKSFSFKGNAEREKAFDEDMKAFFDYHYRNAKVYNKKTGARTYGMKSQYSEENLALIQKMWEKLPKSMRLQWASEIQNARSNYNKYMRSMESDGLNPLLSLFNGSIDEDDSEVASPSSAGGKRSKKRRKAGASNRTKRKNKSRVRQSSGSSNTSSTVSVDEDKLNKISEEEYQDYLSDYTDTTRGWFSDNDKIKGLNKKKPVTLLGNIMKKVDGYLYDFIFGNDEFENDKNENGFLKATIDQMKGTFDKFNGWLEANILFPLKSKFTKQKIHDAASTFFGMFGIDLDDTVKRTKEYLFGDKKDKNGLFGGLIKDVKASFGGVKDYVKKSFTDVFNYFNIFGTRTAEGQAKKDRNKNRQNVFTKYLQSKRSTGDLGDALRGLRGAGDTEPVENAAEGMRRVSKTGIIAASEGEMVIPPDMNPFNIRKRYREENKQKARFLSAIQNYAGGGKIDFSSQEISDKQKAHNNATKEATRARLEAKVRERAQKEKTTRDDFIEGEESLIFKMYDEARNGVETIKGAVSYLLGGSDLKSIKSKMSDDFNNMTTDVMGNIRKYAPDMISGGIIGAGTSFITGMIGGPLLGAAAGASIGLIKNSDAVKKWLFGDIDENGERKGGVLSKNISNNIEKYFPDMGKGATVGAITSILPFVPGGPVAGIIVGSSIGFAKNNESIQRALFGEEGLLGPGFPDKVKKVLPKMGVGALAGLVAGPFGVATNVVLGSALGFATDTNAFKDAIFGKEDKDGVREGGLLGSIKDHMIEPSKEFFSDMFKDFKDWFNKDIKENVKDFIDPFNKRIEMFIQGTIKTIGSVFEKAANRFMGTKIGKAVDKITSLSLGLIGKVAGAGKAAVGLPFKFLGATGRRWRSIDIAKGRATYMSAQERLNYANSNKFKRGLFWHRNPEYRMNEFDTTLAGLSDEEVSELNTSMDYIRNTRKAAAKEKKKSIRNLNSLKQVLDKRRFNSIMSALEAGDIDQALNIANTVSETYTDKKGNIVSVDKAGIIKVIKTEGAKLKRSLNAENNEGEALEKAKQYLKDKGIKYNDKNLKKVMDYVKAEDKLRNGHNKGGYEQKSEEELALERATKRHKEIVDLFNEAIENLKKLNNTSDQQLEEEQKQREELEQNTIATNNEVTDEILDADFREVTDEEANQNRRVPKKGIKGLYYKAKNKISSMIRDRIPQTEEQTEDENSNVRYSFANGFAMKFIRTKQNTWSADKSDSDTMSALRQNEEQQETQKGILASLTSIPGKIFSFFGGKAEEDSGDKKEGIFSKILKGATKLAVLGGLIMFAPKIVGFLKDKVAPIITDLKDGFISGWKHTGETLNILPEKIGGFFGEHLNNGTTFLTDFMMGQGQFAGKGLPYLFQDKIVPAMCSGFEVLMGTVAPFVVRTFAKALPSLIKSGILGLKDFFVGVFKGEGNTKPSYENGDTTSSNVSKVSVSSKVNYTPSNNWNVGSGTTSAKTSGGSSGSFGSSSSGRVSKAYGTNLTDEERDEKSKEIRKYVDNNDYDITSKVPEAIGRSFVTGRTMGNTLSKAGTVLNKGGKVLSKFGLAGKVGGSAMKLTGYAAKGVNKAVNAAGTLGGYILPTGVVGADNKNKALTTMAEKRGQIAEKLTSLKESKVGQYTSKAYNAAKNSKVGQTIAEMGKDGLAAMRSTAQKASESKAGSVIKKLIEFINKHFIKAITDNKVVNFVYNKFKDVSKGLTKEALQKSLENFAKKLVPMVTKALGEKAGQLTGKAIAKISATVASGGIAFIAFAVISFISGWKKADEYLNISDPSVIQRLVSGVIMIINDNLCFGLLPLNWLYEQVINIAEGIPFFESSIKNLRQKQAETEDERDEYNLKNGTNLTTDEYLQAKKKEKSVFHRVGSAISGVGKKIGSGISSFGTSIKNAIFGQPVSAAELTDEQQAQLNQNQTTVSTLNTMVGTSTVSALQNANDTMSNLVNEMDGSLDSIDKEHDLNKKNAADTTLKNYWKTKKRITGTGIGATLTNFITMTEKALLFPITLMNAMLKNANDYTTAASNSTSTSTGTTSSSSSGGSSGSFASSSSKSTTTTTSTKNKGILATAISGVKKFASGIWSGVKSLFGGKGSGLSNEQPEPYDIAKPISSYTSVDDIRSLRKNGLFVSQIDSSYASRPFRSSDESGDKDTVSDAGCAPAAATMAVNLANKGGFTNKTLTFDQSIKNATKYKSATQGVTADYFINEFSKNGLSTAFVSSDDSNMSNSVTSLLRNNHPIVLVGTDTSNKSKKNSPFGPAGHYVVATGLSEDGKKIYINDPESKTPNSVYDTDKVLGSVSLGIAPVRKDAALDAKVKNSNIANYMARFRAFGLTGSSNKEKVWNYLRSKGCSEACTAGIIGNLMQEAGTDVNPSSKQSGGGPGRGICQWTYGSDRWNKLMSVCNSKGASWDDLESQCIFMWQEMQNESTWISKLKSNYSLSVSDFIKVTDIEKATKAFCTCFERAGTAKMDKRISYAKQTYQEFTGKAVPASSGDGLTAVGNVDFHKYTDASDKIIRGIAAISVREQGTDPEGYMAEASLIANKTELAGGSTAADLEKMATSSWFAGTSTSTYDSGSGVTDEIFNNVKKVLVEGKRTLPVYVDEHDCNYSQDYDISSAKNNGTAINFLDRTKWEPFVTKYRNKYQDSSDKDINFYGFPNYKNQPNDCDVFGYSSEENRTKYGDGHYDVDGNAIGSTNGTASGDAEATSEPAWKNPKSILDIFTVFDTLAEAYGLSSSGSSSSSSSSSSGSAASGNATELQKKLANSFIQSENAIPTYSQDDRYNFTVSDDGKISGSAIDCSAAVQKVYQKILNVDPGSWTGDMGTNSNLTTVEQGSGSPGSDGPTISKMQLGDIVLYGKDAGTHVEMFTGKSDKGYTMGAGSAPAPHWDKGSDVNGKLSDWHTQNSGFWSVRRYKGFDGSSSSSTSDTSSTKDTKDNKTTDSKSKTVAGKGSGLLGKLTRSKIRENANKAKRRIFFGKGSDIQNTSKAENIISSTTKTAKSYNITPTSYNNAVLTGNTTKVSPVYSYNATTSTVNNVSGSSTSEQLVEMLKAIIKILVRIVDNSDNMKQIVALLTELVSAVTVKNNSDSDSKSKSEDITQLKLNLTNAINTATQSNPDKELMEIINSMESLASM